MRHLILATLLITTASPAIAGEEATASGPWHSEAELGFVQTGGNTQTQTLNTRGEVIRDVEAWRTTLKASALASNDKQTTTAERYTASLQQDYKLTEKDYIFGLFAFESDRFDGFKRRLSETAGYGRILFNSDEVNWKFEIGGGSRQTAYIDRTTKREIIGRSLTAIEWKINDASTLTQELKSEGGDNGFVSNSTTTLQHKLNSRLSTKISYGLQYTSKVPVGTRKTNTEMAVTLVWSH